MAAHETRGRQALTEAPDSLRHPFDQLAHGRQRSRLGRSDTSPEPTHPPGRFDDFSALPLASGPPSVALQPALPPPDHPAAQEPLRQPGVPLDAVTRSFFEARFGHDFAQVRTHSDAAAARSATALGARAYAIGSHVVFGAGSPGDRLLLAHELAHVVQQQRGGDTTAPGHGDTAAPGHGMAALEQDASQAAAAAVHGSGRVRVHGRGRRVPMRQALDFLTAADLAKLRRFGEADYEASLRALGQIFNKTRGFNRAGDTLEYIQIRQASGELRTMMDYLRDPTVDALKVVPSGQGGRSPDFYVRRAGGEPFRVEVVNVTQASTGVTPEVALDGQGRLAPRITRAENPKPGKAPVVQLPTKDMRPAAIKDAIAGKVSPRNGAVSQLDAQNLNTRAGGQPMNQGGDVVVQVLEGEVTKAEMDAIIADLAPVLRGSSAQRVVISARDAAGSGSGRTLFTYARQADGEFLGATRTPWYRAVPEATAPVAAGAVGRAGQVAGTLLRGAAHAAVMVALEMLARWLLGKAFEAQLRGEIEQRLGPEIEARMQRLQPRLAALQGTRKLFVRVTYGFQYAAAHHPSAGVPPLFVPGSLHVIGVHPGNEELDFAADSGERPREAFTPQTDLVQPWYSYSVLLDDPAQRARTAQQARLAESIRNGSVAAPATAPPAAAPPQALAPLLPLPSAPAQAPVPSLLPGPGVANAPPRVEPEAVVGALKGAMVALLQQGERLAAAASPARADIEAFGKAEHAWRDRATYAWNHYHDQGPDTARAAMDNMLHADREGGRLIALGRMFGLPEWAG